MNPRLAPVRQGGVESVHQEALSPTDAAPEVHPARRRGRIDPAQQRSARLLEREQLVVQALQAFERTLLRGVQDDAAALELRLEMPEKRAASDGEVRVGVVHRVAPDSRALLRAEMHWAKYLEPQRLRVRLSTASAASFTASDSEG